MFSLLKKIKTLPIYRAHVLSSLDSYLSTRTNILTKAINSTLNASWFIYSKLQTVKQFPSTTGSEPNLNVSGYEDYVEECIAKIDKKRVIILTTPHCLFIARLLQDKLKKVGIVSEIIQHKPKEGFSKNLHIVICPQIFEDLPPYYIAYQMEQSVSSRWFDEKYFKRLQRAIAVLDYSIENIKFLLGKGFSYKQLFFLPIFSANFTDSQDEYMYDVLFYGDINNERRKSVLEKLKKKYKVKIISNLFGEELYKEIKRAKVILNLHYYEGALLESTRIFEVLSLGKIIISERGSDQEEYAYLDGIVEFVDVGDYEAIDNAISKWSDPERIKEKVKDNNKKLLEKFDLFEFYFYRMLLAFDLITFDQFYYTIGQKLFLPKNYVCLSLTESIQRRNYFNLINKGDAFIFQGLRHYKGWIGCGLSYKFLLMRAKYQNFPLITICEDDVVFYNGFENRYKNVLNYLKEHIDWDVFAGVIADLSEDTKVIKVIKEKKEEIVYIDKMVSMVFNVYNNSFYDKLISWNYWDRDLSNTIDRYLERSANIRVVTLSEFLVGHQEDQVSTLWTFQNSTYNSMIARSEKLLAEKIDGFRT